jgi:hypothetical protein
MVNLNAQIGPTADRGTLSYGRSRATFEAYYFKLNAFDLKIVLQKWNKQRSSWTLCNSVYARFTGKNEGSIEARWNSSRLCGAGTYRTVTRSRVKPNAKWWGWWRVNSPSHTLPSSDGKW